ncbi:MAG: TetR/AcrR family transcriptional regulator [Deltaproteobacteria bacterium]|nr:TetR/AcrR family transcriptional regulator [Deltaproteobacteria bacterium]MBW2417610.1 TetR/AcrR family transcriptional regulator [Deltaproteobacteria bacterium]
MSSSSTGAQCDGEEEVEAENGQKGEGASRAEKKAQSRRRILDAARDVFFRDGFMPANLDEVAEKAGVAKGTLYRYFDSKADLYVAVLAENGKAFSDKMQEAIVEGSSGMEQLQLISRFYLEHWTRHREYFQIFWAIDNQAVIGELPSQVLDEVSKLWETSLAIVNTVLERCVRDGEIVECDTWEVANILWTLANGLIQAENTGARRTLRRRSLEDVYADGIRLILNGLALPESADSP